MSETIAYMEEQTDAAKRDRALTLAEAVLEWARTPGPHGGNPYTLHHVQLARHIVDGKWTSERTRPGHSCPFCLGKDPNACTAELIEL